MTSDRIDKVVPHQLGKGTEARAMARLARHPAQRAEQPHRRLLFRLDATKEPRKEEERSCAARDENHDVQILSHRLSPPAPYVLSSMRSYYACSTSLAQPLLFPNKFLARLCTFLLSNTPHKLVGRASHAAIKRHRDPNGMWGNRNCPTGASAPAPEYR